MRRWAVLKAALMVAVAASAGMSQPVGSAGQNPAPVPVSGQPPAVSHPPETVVIDAPVLLGAADMADQMVLSLREAGALAGRRLAVLPFFDLNDLQTTTALGRLVGEELAAALHFRGFHLTEIRTDDQLIAARRVGESFLARTGPDRSLPARTLDLAWLSERNQLGALVVGTYSAIVTGSGGLFGGEKGGLVGLNARLIAIPSGAVLAMGTAKVDLDASVQALLKTRNTLLPPPEMVEIKARRF